MLKLKNYINNLDLKDKVTIMSSEIAREIIKNIATGKLDNARDSVNTGLQKATADAIDMKRIDMQLDWMNKQQK